MDSWNVTGITPLSWARLLDPAKNDERWVTFLDFVQSMAIRDIRIAHPHIHLDKIRETVDMAKSKFKIDYPFARKHTTKLSLANISVWTTEQKKGADKGIDGRLYFHDEDQAKTKQVIFSVKAGHASVPHLRDLRGVLDRENAQIGVLLTMGKNRQ